MSQLAALVRGLMHRGGSTIVILLVAVAAAAAAAAGPIYYQAAKISVMRDMTEHQPLVAWGYEANLTGPLNGISQTLNFGASDELDLLFGASTVRRLFAPPVVSLEGTAGYAPLDAQFALVWRSGMCAHLRIRGACPSAADQVLVSARMAGLNHWHIGQRLTGTGWRGLTIAGVYQPPDINSPYWAARATNYFPAEALSGAANSGQGFDAFFTARRTLATAPDSRQGAAVIDDYLTTAGLRQSDIGLLGPRMAALASSQSLVAQNIIVSTTVSDTADRIEANWRTIAVPVLLITIEVLTLSWLLLFLAVTDAVEARGPEVALAKLRGHGRWRALVFGLSEPALLLLVALPTGILAGWAAATAIGHLVLRPGTPIGMSWPAWAAAAAATVGGMTAVLLAARRTLQRGVVQQFRRSGRRAADRGWVMDAILLTGSAAGLLDLAVTGRIGSAGHDVLGLLVPGLLGMALAVVASRLLPLGCRSVYDWTGRRGPVALFLAIRHIARRPGGARTTIVLATSFALTTFAVAAWAVSQANYQLVAGAATGAPVVLTVAPPPGRDLGAIVDHADPSGRLAAVVDSYVSLSGSSAGDVTLGVDPARFAQVAFWPRGFAAAPLTELAKRLAPPAPPPLVLTGDAIRLKVRVTSLSLPGEKVSANVTTGASPVDLGALPAHGMATLRGELVGCPCVLQSLSLDRSGAAIRSNLTSPLSFKLTITSIEVRVAGVWKPLRPHALAAAAWWRAGQADSPPDVISATAAGISWSASGIPIADSPTLVSVNRPKVLPALVPRNLVAGRTGVLQGTDFTGGALALQPIPVTAAPGAPANGAVVDRRYAELASNEDFTYVTQQVWLAAGAQQRMVAALKAAGVRIDSTATAAGAAKALGRQGPGLASLLFLADAAAAALLAVGAAILNLYLSARRRRYEYAALEASGVARSTLRRALLIELAVVLGFGTLVGVTTGLGAARLVLRTIPEFVHTPASPPLVYSAPPVPLALLIGVAILALAVASTVASSALIRGVRSDQLREAPA